MTASSSCVSTEGDTVYVRTLTHSLSRRDSIAESGGAKATRLLERLHASWPIKAVLAASLAAGVAFWVETGVAGRTLAGIGRADPRLESAAALAFLASLLASALSWRAAFTALGAPSSRIAAGARYAAGSVANTFTPAHAGDVVRATLFARELPRRRRLSGAVAAIAVIAVSRALVHSVVLVGGALAGAFPWWPVLALVGIAIAVLGGLFGLHRVRSSRFEQYAAALLGLLALPRLTARLVTYASAAVIARMLAAAAVASALGVPSPMLAALAMTAALDLAALVPLVPGGVGLVSGAVSVALVARGATPSAAIATGLIFHALETLTSLGFAGVCIPLAARPALARNPLARGAGALAVASAAAFVVAMVLIPTL